MLDNGTKRKIDNARNILVGKVPDPKSQVEQITIALIYKFMDDMDKQSEEWGGEATFFSGKYKKYSWSRIFDPKLGGFELINTYGEALIEMNQNPNIPQLFRDIFKNAYLPYRDPETLKSFLKEINEFKYDHSEQLGNAYEYLLSVLSAQGDAGQFRTPRHIIDFIVEIIRPEKKDTVLDPACGTAGFLISSYKHILNANADKYPGDKLTPDERKRMLNNFIGYDISPDMARLSLVNMYLHGFADPNIVEYDALTSEARWNDTYDVILANPPFMSPKGGIRPHKRFSIQAKRSEVLFVDYIAEHLNPNGRAGVIVPEGIIFQSQTAYKNLRKMLVEDCLWAVVSLPAGIFNPYAGVKTSILLMDKGLAKKSDSVLFVKIENDGYDLGAQRRPVDKNDLPGALEFIKDAYTAMVAGQDVKEVPFAHIVDKGKIAESGEWSLSGERYKLNHLSTSIEWEMVEIGNKRYFEIKSGGTPSSKNPVYWDGDINWATLVDLPQDNFITEIRDTKRKITNLGLNKSSAKLLPKNSILVSSRATIGRVAIARVELATNQGFKNIIIKDFNRSNEKFVALAITQLVDEMIRNASGGTFKEISKTTFSKLKIPLPPLEVQQAIVAEIDTYQKIIDGARQVVDNYKPSFKIDPDWEIASIKDVCIIKPPKSELKNKSRNLEVSFVPMSDLNANQMFFKAKEVKKFSEVIKGYTYFKNNDVLLAKITPCFENGKAGIVKNMVNGFGFGSTEFFVIRAGNFILPEWIYYFISTEKFILSGKNNMTGSAGQQRVPIEFLKGYKIPVPSIDIQRKKIEIVNTEQELVNANKQLIEIYEQKIKDKIAEVWGE